MICIWWYINPCSLRMLISHFLRQDTEWEADSDKISVPSTVSSVLGFTRGSLVGSLACWGFAHVVSLCQCSFFPTSPSLPEFYVLWVSLIISFSRKPSVLGFSRETETVGYGYLYIKWGIGQHDDRGWEVQNLQCVLTGSRPRRACSVQRPEDRDPGEPTPLMKPEIGLQENSFLPREAGLSFYSGLQLLRWNPPTLQRTICFTWSSPT